MEHGMAPRGGRPRSFDRDAALDTAMQLFWRHGYEGVSIADLVAAMGITPPSLYAAFGSKAELYRAALARYRGRPQVAAAAVLDGPGPLVADLRRAMHAAVAAVTEPGRPTGCMVFQGLLACAGAHADLAAETRALRAATQEALRRRLDRAGAAGELAAGADPAVLARTLAALLLGLSVQARDGACPHDLHAVVDQALAALPLAVPPLTTTGRATPS